MRTINENVYRNSQRDFWLSGRGVRKKNTKKLACTNKLYTKVVAYILMRGSTRYYIIYIIHVRFGMKMIDGMNF